MRFNLAISKPKPKPVLKPRPDLRHMLKFVATQAKTCKRCGG